MNQNFITRILAVSAIVMSVAACTTPTSPPPDQRAQKYVSFEGAISVFNSDGQGATTLYSPRLVTMTGLPGVSLRAETAHVGEPVVITAGGVTTAEFETATYGYSLLVTPELVPGESGKIKATIELDHDVKLGDGRASHKTVKGVADLAVGEQTKLHWINNGARYELEFRLAAINPATDK